MNRSRWCRAARAWVAGGACAAAAVTAAAPADAPHPFSARDMVAMQRIADPQPSPDGRLVAFTVKTYDPGSDASSTGLWLARADGGEARRLTTARAADTGPRWAPDGRTVAFLSDRDGSSQIWAIDPRGGEARRVSDFPVEVDNLAWSPDGSRVAFSAQVFPDCDDLACTARRLAERAGLPQATTYTALPVRRWDAWDDGRRNHLFVWSWGGGAPVDVMRGMDADSPTRPFGDTGDFSWAPDGRSIAFVAQMPEGHAWSTDLDVYVAQADGTGVRCLTEDNPASDTSPVFSPAGGRLAWLAMTRPGYESDRRRIVLRDVATGKNRVVAGEWDRSPEALVWSADGRRLFALAEEDGRRKIFAVDPAGGRVTVVVGDHHNDHLRATAAGRLVFTQDSLTAPAEVFSSALDGSDRRALTRLNEARLAAVRMSVPGEFRFTGARGDGVRGWLLKPVDFDPAKRYPVALLIHGGPQNSWLDAFHYRWNLQAYAGAGYVAVTLDFHGSTGYGQAFTDAINGDWGGAPYEDLMKGLDHVLATYPFADGGRVAALGASYGGYMVNWIAGHTDRFRCLVSHDGIFDLRSAYYATEELWFPEWEFGGTPWEKPELYARWSPSGHVARWTTPMLIIHGDLDYRLPLTEGLAAFTALQRRGVPSQFLRFPDENHWVRKPRNSLLWHDTVLAWLARWLGE